MAIVQARTKYKQRIHECINIQKFQSKLRRGHLGPSGGSKKRHTPVVSTKKKRIKHYDNNNSNMIIPDRISLSPKPLNFFEKFSSHPG